MSDCELGACNQYTCRICFDETSDREEVIVPCLCSGTGKYICKECLEDWRANGATARAFTHCPTCDFEYHLERNCPTDRFQNGKICCFPATFFGRKSYFHFLVFSDFFLGFFVINMYLIGFAIIIRWFDGQERLVDLMPWDDYQIHDQNEHIIRAFRHHKATYFSASLIANAAFFLLITTWNHFFTCRHSVAKVRYSAMWNYRRLNRTKLAALLFVFVFLKLFVGVFIALLSMVAWMQKAAVRHVHVLEKKKIAKEFRVVDLEKAGRLKYKNILGSEEYVSASAPPKSHHILASNLLERLLNARIVCD